MAVDPQLSAQKDKIINQLSTVLDNYGELRRRNWFNSKPRNKERVTLTTEPFTIDGKTETELLTEFSRYNQSWPITQLWNRLFTNIKKKHALWCWANVQKALQQLRLAKDTDEILSHSLRLQVWLSTAVQHISYLSSLRTGISTTLSQVNTMFGTNYVLDWLRYAPTVTAKPASMRYKLQALHHHLILVNLLKYPIHTEDKDYTGYRWHCQGRYHQFMHCYYQAINIETHPIIKRDLIDDLMKHENQIYQHMTANPVIPVLTFKKKLETKSLQRDELRQLRIYRNHCYAYFQQANWWLKILLTQYSHLKSRDSKRADKEASAAKKLWDWAKSLLKSYPAEAKYDKQMLKREMQTQYQQLYFYYNKFMATYKNKDNHHKLRRYFEYDFNRVLQHEPLKTIVKQHMQAMQSPQPLTKEKETKERKERKDSITAAAAIPTISTMPAKDIIGDSITPSKPSDEKKKLSSLDDSSSLPDNIRKAMYAVVKEESLTNRCLRIENAVIKWLTELSSVTADDGKSLLAQQKISMKTNIQEIRRNLLLICHPDKNPTCKKEAEDNFKRIKDKFDRMLELSQDPVELNRELNSTARRNQIIAKIIAEFSTDLRAYLDSLLEKWKKEFAAKQTQLDEKHRKLELGVNTLEKQHTAILVGLKQLGFTPPGKEESTTTLASSSSLFTHAPSNLSASKVKGAGLVAVVTLGLGDDALHATLGQWDDSKKHIMSTETSTQRKRLEKAIDTCADEKKMSRVKSVSISCIKELIRCGHSIGEKAHVLLQAHQQFTDKRKDITEDLWQIFEQELKEHPSIVDHIQPQNHLTTQANLRAQFHKTLKQKDSELYSRILSLPVLARAFHDYNTQVEDGFDWETQITPDVIKEYAKFFGAPAQRLLPNALEIIAIEFNITITLYISEHATPQIFNAGQKQKIQVLFADGYYKRLASVHTYTAEGPLVADNEKEKGTEKAEIRRNFAYH